MVVPPPRSCLYCGPGRLSKIGENNAPGAQRIAAEWAESRGVRQIVFLAEFETRGRGASLERDKAIVDASPKLVVNLTDGKKATFLAE